MYNNRPTNETVGKLRLAAVTPEYVRKRASAVQYFKYVTQHADLFKSLAAFLNVTDRRVSLFQVELWEMAARLFETVVLPIKVAHQRLMELLLA